MRSYCYIMGEISHLAPRGMYKIYEYWYTTSTGAGFLPSTVVGSNYGNIATPEDAQPFKVNVEGFLGIVPNDTKLNTYMLPLSKPQNQYQPYPYRSSYLHLVVFSSKCRCVCMYIYIYKYLYIYIQRPYMDPLGYHVFSIQVPVLHVGVIASSHLLLGRKFPSEAPL